jgi:hypothetical protein
MNNESVLQGGINQRFRGSGLGAVFAGFVGLAGYTGQWLLVDNLGMLKHALQKRL